MKTWVSVTLPTRRRRVSGLVVAVGSMLFFWRASEQKKNMYVSG